MALDPYHLPAGQHARLWHRMGFYAGHGVYCLKPRDRSFSSTSFLFLLLPGLVFSVLVRLGVRRWVAWHWMWLAPTGYCFLLQAGSIANDSFGAPFALAAVDFALRARISRRPLDFFFFPPGRCPLLTGAKASNLPLLLPWAIALPAFVENFSPTTPLAAVAVCLIAVFSSFLPTRSA